MAFVLVLHFMFCQIQEDFDLISSEIVFFCKISFDLGNNYDRLT
jgi:hypothetical protein